MEFIDVTFKYKSSNSNAIEHMSFVINPGETVAFEGESGCGKTTVLQLIERFYNIDSGCILLVDFDISTLSPNFVRSQTPVLFSMSISDNIRYSNVDKTDSDVVNIAQIGNSQNFIIEILNSYNALVENASLSDG